MSYKQLEGGDPGEADALHDLHAPKFMQDRRSRRKRGMIHQVRAGFADPSG